MDDESETVVDKTFKVIADCIDTVYTDEDAWEALKSWRGLRAPNRLQEIDPAALRETADSLPKDEIMSKFSRASSIEELKEIYHPLVSDFESEIVTIQISSTNQEETIKLLGKELLPILKK